LPRGTIFRELHNLYPSHACQEYNENWPMLVKHCGYRLSTDYLIMVIKCDIVGCFITKSHCKKLVFVYH